MDVGGTFTDVVALDGSTGEIRVGKRPTDSDDPAAGVLDALAATGWPLANAALLVHGTTITTNALLQRRLSRTGMITTEGFRDVIELGRRTRPHAYGLKGGFQPIIARDLRLEVSERIDALGHVLVPLDPKQVREAARRLLDLGCESVVIHFLHACTNPVHELEAAEAIMDLWPNGHITLGHRLVSELREYERGVTAAVNASVQPILERYVSCLSQGLRKAGYDREFLLMSGNGGPVSAALASTEAARTVMSGPASGVIAAAASASLAGFDSLLTYDMGGTSTDVALVSEGRPMISSEIEIDYALPIHVPMVDVRTIGAGGGSILWVDAAGFLQVGPQSAGSHPGPISFGRGGRRPTITDANVLLGRLEPSELLGVDAPVEREQVAEIFAEEIGKPLGLGPHDAARAALAVANLKMAGAIRLISIDRGHDPRGFALFAFGGGGPLHASAVAAELGVRRIIIPPRPGITNAIGCLVADLRHESLQTINRPLTECDAAALDRLLEAQREEGLATLARETVTPERIVVERSFDMKFTGQTHLIRVPLPDGPVSIDAVDRRFGEVYWERFRVRLPEIRASVVTVSTTVIGVLPRVDLAGLLPRDERASDVSGAWTATRQLWLADGPADVPVYDRARLPAKVRVAGPAVLTQLDTTTVLEPGDVAEVDQHDHLIVDKRPTTDR